MSDRRLPPLHTRLACSPLVALGLIGVCLVSEATVLGVGIDDLDEGYFAQQAVRVLHGQIPYRDFQSLYTPGLAYLHAGVFSVLGGPYWLGPRLIALLSRAGLALLLYFMARPLVRRPLWAAAPGVFLLVGLDDAPERWEPHPGWLSTLFALLAAWCVSQRPTGRWLLAGGLAAGAAYLFKQNTGVFILAAIVLRGALSSDARTRKTRVPLAGFAGVTLVWLAPLLVVVRDHLGSLGVLVGAVNQAGLLSPPEPTIAIPLLCLAGGMRVQQHEPNPRLGWYLLAGGSLFLTQYPRMDTLHLAWSAPLLLVVGAAVLDRLRPRDAGLVAIGLVLMATPMVLSRVEFLRLPRTPVLDVPFAAGLEAPISTGSDLQGVVADIQRRTQPGEPIFVYPTAPLVYALAARPNPTRFDHLNPGAADAQQIEDVVADLEAARVGLIVVSDFWTAAWGEPGLNAPLVSWIDANFETVARDGAYRVLVRR